MNIPTITGVIRRRILLNYRIAPDAAQAVLPDRFRPKLADGYSIGGICLIRLEEIRPTGLPRFFGISSENSAHRIAVEWEDDTGNLLEGVFVSRRDTSSRLNALAGGRLFPGIHHHAKLIVSDQNGAIALTVVSDDRERPLVDLQASESADFPATSIFPSLQAASTFFERGCIGYSPRPDSCVLDGILLRVTDWRVSPLKVHHVTSAYYDDRSIFPAGRIQFDHALLMRDIVHEWHSEPSMIMEKTAGER